jgi:tRNA G37 N-methylase TrmD
MSAQVDAQGTLAPLKKFAVGEAVYTGGEVPAMAIVDAITRRIPGVLGKDASVEERRVAAAQVYTRPETILYKKKKYRVPKVLQTGHHANIDAWRSNSLSDCLGVSGIPYPIRFQSMCSNRDKARRTLTGSYK